MSWIPALLLGGLIFYFSTIPQPPIPNPFVNFDKVAHMGAYVLLSLALAWGWARSFEGKLLQGFFTVFLTASVYGAALETIQRFLPARDANLYDALSNLIGALLGAFFYLGSLYAKGTGHRPSGHRPSL